MKPAFFKQSRIALLMLECFTVITGFLARPPTFISFTIAPIGSVINFFKCYQDDFLTPGIIPSFESSLKQILQRPKSLIYPFPLPHRKQRFFALVENLGVRAARTFTDVFAIFINTSQYHTIFLGYLRPKTRIPKENRGIAEVLRYYQKGFWMSNKKARQKLSGF
jgi:hypothetical protein